MNSLLHLSVELTDYKSMKKITTLIIACMLTFCQSYGQNMLISGGLGISGLYSDFENKYGSGPSMNFNAGFESKNEGLGYVCFGGIHYFTSKVVAINDYFRVGVLRLAFVPKYAFSKGWTLTAGPSIGLFSKKEEYIDGTKYRYTFDQLDYSVETAIWKEVKSGPETLCLGIAYNRSVDGIIHGNFWQQDNLKLYSINFNAKCIFK